MDREEEGPISLGGNVQYQYKVTNPNTSTVDNVAVTDDHLGVIASGQSIPPGGSVTFKKTATLYGTTTNVATATGDVAGDICEPGSDTRHDRRARTDAGRVHLLGSRSTSSR